jgi:hypothetical protein
MIQMWRILTGKDRVDPANWSLEVRREFFSIRVVDEYNSLPDRVKMATNMNMFKARLDEHLGTPAPLQCSLGGGGEEGSGHTREERRQMDPSQWPEDHFYIHNMLQYLWPFGLHYH